jgi:hypothetical protein
MVWEQVFGLEMEMLLIEWEEGFKQVEFGLTVTMLIRLMLLLEVTSNLELVERLIK